VCSSITTTMLSRMVVRAFVGPRPVFSRSSLTIALEISMWRPFREDCVSGWVAIGPSDLAFPWEIGSDAERRERRRAARARDGLVALLTREAGLSVAGRG